MGWQVVEEKLSPAAGENALTPDRGTCQQPLNGVSVEKSMSS